VAQREDLQGYIAKPREQQRKPRPSPTAQDWKLQEWTRKQWDRVAQQELAQAQQLVDQQRQAIQQYWSSVRVEDDRQRRKANCDSGQHVLTLITNEQDNCLHVQRLCKFCSRVVLDKWFSLADEVLPPVHAGRMIEE
jgi:hypothetical protein